MWSDGFRYFLVGVAIGIAVLPYHKQIELHDSKLGAVLVMGVFWPLLLLHYGLKLADMYLGAWKLLLFPKSKESAD